MSELVDEIRINSNYTQFLQSEYDKTEKDDSIPKIRKHVTPTNTYLTKMSSGFGSAGILPPNCRYIESLQNGHLVVIEEPPAYRTIKVQYSMANEIHMLKNENKIEEYGIDPSFYADGKNMPYNFTLAFPYTIFILMIDQNSALMNGQVYLRNARLAGYSDYLLKMPMMNISNEQSICFGDKVSGRHRNLNAAIENTIMVFWSAIFNSDYIYNYTAYKNIAGVNTYLGWQALSQIDPLFIYNVDWIKMDKNLHQTITSTKEHYNNRSKTGLQYRELSSLFTQPGDTGKEEKPYKRSRKKQKLFYDIAQGIYIDTTFYIHVGDPIMLGKKKAFISSFIGFFESDSIRYIELELEGGKLITIKFSPKLKDIIHASAKKLRFAEEGTLKNGTVIKENDIIIVKDYQGLDIYKKVHFIRNARDGVTEARLGNSFHVLENTEGSILNIASPMYNDIKLDKKTKYILAHASANGMMHGGREVTYNSIDVRSNGTLILQFIGTDQRMPGAKYNINMSTPAYEKPKPLFPIDECHMMPPVFRVGRKLMCVKGSKCESGYIWGTPEGIVHDINYGISLPTVQDVIEHLLSKDGSTFSVEGFDMNISFSVGDKVVYADWKNPINMLIPRTITAFKTETDTGDLYFVLSDKDGLLTQVRYISGISQNSTSPYIHTGRIRKIENKFGRVISGTKIIAQKSYIPHFPKKDVNIIIGFITDTGGDDPLVLCSNCCTLWYSEMMENFKRVSMKAKKWAVLNHAPIDITKIKAQPGDIINGTADYKQKAAWLVSRIPDYKTSRIMSLNNYSSYPDNYALDGYVRNHTFLDCIPNPRISPTEQTKMEVTSAWPNFHGLFTKSKMSPYRFLTDERSILHV